MLSASWLSAVFVLVLAAASAFAQQPTPQQPNASKPKPDNWQRMKECADQVARISKREGMRSGRDVGGEIVVLGIENHYSPTYERCYARVNYVNQDKQAVKNGMPLTFYELYDAFEEKSLSVCTDHLVAARFDFCTIQDKENSGDCTACRAFVKDRMTK